jgi:hypothetical protein
METCFRTYTKGKYNHTTAAYSTPGMFLDNFFTEMCEHFIPIKEILQSIGREKVFPFPKLYRVYVRSNQYHDAVR